MPREKKDAAHTCRAVACVSQSEPQKKWWVLPWITVSMGRSPRVFAICIRRVFAIPKFVFVFLGKFPKQKKRCNIVYDYWKVRFVFVRRLRIPNSFSFFWGNSRNRKNVAILFMIIERSVCVRKVFANPKFVFVLLGKFPKQKKRCNAIYDYWKVRFVFVRCLRIPNSSSFFWGNSRNKKNDCNISWLLKNCFFVLVRRLFANLFSVFGESNKKRCNVHDYWNRHKWHAETHTHLSRPTQPTRKLGWNKWKRENCWYS